MYLGDVPEKTPIGQSYKRVLREIDEHARVNIPYEKLQRREAQLSEMVEAADIENTTPEEFSRVKAELELTTRRIQKLKPEEGRLFRRVQLAGESLQKLQGELAADVDKLLSRGHGLMTAEVNALKRQILYRYSDAENV